MYPSRICLKDLLGLMAKLVPGDGMSLVRSIVSDIVSHKHTHFLTLGLVFTILDSSSGVAATTDGLDVIYRVRETRPVWKTRPIGPRIVAEAQHLSQQLPELSERVSSGQLVSQVGTRRGWSVETQQRIQRLFLDHRTHIVTLL
jgi:hypothetical protein